MLKIANVLYRGIFSEYIFKDYSLTQDTIMFTDEEYDELYEKYKNKVDDV